MNNTIAISSDFLSSYSALGRDIQKATTDFMTKFRTNPKGMNYEKIGVDSDDLSIYIVNFDSDHSGIVAKDIVNETYLLLWIDRNDNAREWAGTKTCEINKHTGNIQVFDVVESCNSVSGEKGIFSDVSEENLLKIGVPEKQLDYIRSINSIDEFTKEKNRMPADAYELLLWVSDGYDADEVIEAFYNDEDKSAANLKNALDSAENRYNFYVVEGEQELREIMAAPLEKWRIFLHPMQRRIVCKDYSGPVRVIGMAGTGKTVVAMHRAKYLAEKCEDNQRILFTTFTTNLAMDIKENLRRICSASEMKKIDVINLDSWVNQYLREHEYTAKIVYGKEERELFEKAVQSVDIMGEFSVEFYIEEWYKVVAPQEAFTLEKYVKCVRIGRGTRLDRKKKIAVWKVFERYQEIMKEENKRDICTAMYECSVILKQSSDVGLYRHIIVDEAQDFTSNAFRLIRCLAGDEKKNDIFITGDSHQRIYKNKASLSKCGINIRGRGKTLKINYRTTAETEKYALDILNGVQFDDLDESIDNEKCKSLLRGEKPVVTNYKNANDEIEAVCRYVDELIQHGAALSDICIAARTGKLVRMYLEGIAKHGYKTFEIIGDKNDSRNIDGIRFATMHRIKGLEFNYVFVMGVNDGIIPLESDSIDQVSEIESEVREKSLLYVAVTRAKKGVYISSNGRKSKLI